MAIVVFWMSNSVVFRGFHGWAGTWVEPVSTVCHCSGLRKCVFMVWSSKMARILTWTLNILFLQTSSEDALLSFSPSCPLAAPVMLPDSLPRLWCYINLLLTYLLTCLHGKTVFPGVEGLLVCGRASPIGRKMSSWSKSALCATVLGSECFMV